MELKLISQEAPGSKVADPQPQPEAQQIHVALESRPEHSSPDQHEVEELRSPPAPSKSSPAISFVSETKLQLHFFLKAESDRSMIRKAENPNITHSWNPNLSFGFLMSMGSLMEVQSTREIMRSSFVKHTAMPDADPQPPDEEGNALWQNGGSPARTGGHRIPRVALSAGTEKSTASTTSIALSSAL